MHTVFWELVGKVVIPSPCAYLRVETCLHSIYIPSTWSSTQNTAVTKTEILSSCHSQHKLPRWLEQANTHSFKLWEFSPTSLLSVILPFRTQTGCCYSPYHQPSFSYKSVSHAASSLTFLYLDASYSISCVNYIYWSLGTLCSSKWGSSLYLKLTEASPTSLLSQAIFSAWNVSTHLYFLNHL